MARSDSCVAASGAATGRLSAGAAVVSGGVFRADPPAQPDDRAIAASKMTTVPRSLAAVMPSTVLHFPSARMVLSTWVLRDGYPTGKPS